jgi:hypothetical protein
MARRLSRRTRRKSPADGGLSNAVRQFLVRELGQVPCMSCGHHNLRLLAVESIVFLGGSRLSFRCKKCAEASERLLIHQP